MTRSEYRVFVQAEGLLDWENHKTPTPAFKSQPKDRADGLALLFCSASDP